MQVGDENPKSEGAVRMRHKKLLWEISQTGFLVGLVTR